MRFYCTTSIHLTYHQYFAVEQSEVHFVLFVDYKVCQLDNVRRLPVFMQQHPPSTKNQYFLK